MWPPTVTPPPGRQPWLLVALLYRTGTRALAPQDDLAQHHKHKCKQQDSTSVLAHMPTCSKNVVLSPFFLPPLLASSLPPPR